MVQADKIIAKLILSLILIIALSSYVYILRAGTGNF